jgi:hypothetical protein
MGLYSTADQAAACTACGHLDLDHEPRGFHKPCLPPALRLRRPRHGRRPDPMSLDEQVELDPEPFLQALRTAMRPEVLLQATDDLGELIQAVKDVGKKGRLTLTIDVVPDQRDPDVVVVTADTAIKKPRPTPNGRLLWPLDGGRLSTKNPKQLELGLTAVDGGHHDNTQEDIV